MIYFVTNRPHHFNNDPRVTITNDTSLCKRYLEGLKTIGFDEEFNGLNPILAIPLLTQVGDEHNQFVIDNISYPNQKWLNPYREKEWIGHNIKIDLSMATVNGFDLKPAKMKIYDTMIAEQRLGLDSKRPNDLAGTYARRCGKVLDKNPRERFTTMDKNSTFELSDILYAAGDIPVLFEIKRAQRYFIDKWNLNFLLYGIEFPLVPIVAQMELEGIKINEPQWLEILEDNKKKLLEVELELDEILRGLGMKIPIRRKEEVIQIGLFGENTSKTNKAVNHTNFSSSAQVQHIFRMLGQIVPNETKKRVDKYTKSKTYEDADTLQEGAVLTYIIENPNSIMIPFLEKYLEYKEVEKEISSFGLKFLKSDVRSKSNIRQLGYKREQTGRVHTTYKQCFTKTGRFSSGDSKWGMYNSQQVPGIKKYRTAFTLSAKEIAEDWWITTSDLSGAETVIMCAFAKDPVLYKWAIEEDDLHSPMATLCWRAIYRSRANRVSNALASGQLVQIDKGIYKTKDSRGKFHTLTADMEITKADDGVYKQLRTDFKAVTFGVIYGAEAKTIAKILNISRAEAQLVIDVIRATIPETFKMVLKAADDAVRNAYVVHNKRTNSLKWFMPIFQGVHTLESSVISSVQSEARNTRIQGTQADMVKEAMVAVYRKFDKLGIEHCPLLQVHDELVWKHKGYEHGEWIPIIMGEVATKYLEGFTKMKADRKIERTWVK